MGVVLLTALLAVLASTAVPALTRITSAQGLVFLDGGVGRAEVESMEAEAGKYSLWIITAARTTGAYLSDAEVSITNEKGVKVFERRLEGPWLMIDLPLGRYEVHARVGQETQKHTTTIHPGDHHQMVFHFNVDADVLPKD